MDLCQTCVYYPPSSCDGKPCMQCDVDNPLLNCYVKKEADSKLTNSDRLRFATDEELAMFLATATAKYCSWRDTVTEESEKWLKWLRQEAK